MATLAPAPLWLLAALMVLAPTPQAAAAPPASRILKEHRAFMAAARHVEARVRLQRGTGQQSPLLSGAHSGLRHLLRLERDLERGEEVELAPEPPPGDEASLTIHRDKSISLIPKDDKDPASTLDLKSLGLPNTPTELRLLALALGVTRVERAFDRTLKTRLPREVLTLDRIDGRLVWALGGEQAALWVDREVYRPTRLHVGPEVLDKDAWTIKMTYGDDKAGRGWFPHRIQIARNERVILIIHVLEATLSR